VLSALAQPENAIFRIAGIGWFGMVALILLVGAWAGFKRPMTATAGWAAALAGFLAVTCMTLFRDGLRDVTLLGKGYDVWQRTVVTNWSVVGLFLVLFVVGLAAIGWLVSVMMRAKPVSEKVA
jgi:hypothetical protein